MARAPIEEEVRFADYPAVRAGIVRWPMSVLRLRSADPEQVLNLAERVLARWRAYSDERVFVLSETDGVPHNTITPIGRRRGEDYELDLVLRNNITTEEFPLGVYHPHQDLHHIKKENIGLIEVMGLAVLPSRLKKELTDLAKAAVDGIDISGDETLGKHAPWLAELKEKYTFTSENAMEILLQETGKVFAAVLEDAGVYKNTPEGRAAFLRFVERVNRE
jgi:UDPglucose--hexose-1-phosphate uridylyltransferase